MSVEIQGVQGYEYQYLVTLLMALNYLEKEKVTVYVESEEDALITFYENGIYQKLYIQVKHHTRPINFEELCTWLGHFGGRQASTCLIQRLQDENTKILFVTSGRCEDRLIPYLEPACLQGWNGNPSSTGRQRAWSKHNQQDVSALRTSLQQQYSKDTELERKRNESVRSFLEDITNTALKKRLENVGVLEQQTMEKSSEMIASMLTCHYAVRASSLPLVISQLEACVRKGRDIGCDIAPFMSSIIDKYAQRLLPERVEYLDIPQQQTCEDTLEQKNALLLTGLPFCGKTTTAQAIAQEYAKQGFEVLETSSMDEGWGFFSHRSNEKRLLLLEDPFGAVQISKRKPEQIRTLRKLINEQASTIRKLIVTTRKDILFAVFNKRTVAECSIESCPWFDLSMVDSGFAQMIWCAVYGDTEESMICFDRIRTHINRLEQGVFFEIGEIWNLKSTYYNVQEIIPQKIEDILHTARVSSEDVVEKICGDGEDSITVFLALGVACNTIRKVSYRDLAYILSDAEEAPMLRPSKRGSRGVSLSFGEKRKDVPAVYPAYTQLYSLSEKQSRILIEFERYGYITIERQAETIRFLHPIFCYAAKLLFLRELERTLKYDQLLALGRHAIGAMDKNVGLCAVEIFYGCLELNCEYRAQILNTLLRALDSRSPAVRDKALLRLETAFDELDPEQQKQMIRAVQDTEFDKYVLWQDGEAICYPEDIIEVQPRRQKLSLTLDKINSIKARSECSAEDMYYILCSNLKGYLSAQLLNIAMDYDESFIREAAVYLLFKNHAKELDIDQYLNAFEDCGVVCQMFFGALQVWPQYTDTTQQRMFDYFTNQLQRVSVTIRAETFLDKFAREDYTGFCWDCFSIEEKQQVWETWCIVYTQFMLSIQVDFVWIDQVHMEECMRTMLQYVHNSKVLKPLFYAWNDWLNRTKTASDFGMCLTEHVLQRLSPEDEERLAFLQELTKVDNTSLATSHMRYLTDHWNLLIAQERELVKNTLLIPREDQQWLQAVVLTREVVPEELQILLLDKIPSSAADWVSALRRKGLLEPCLNVYCGYPQPLWWNGYHHAYIERWTSIIAEELKADPDFDGRAFKIALREFVYCEYNWDDCFGTFREDIWNHLLPNEKKRISVFEELLRVTTTVNQVNKNVWTQYVSRCNPDELTRSFKKIADVIEAIEYYQDLGCYDLFDPTLIEKYLYKLLPIDNLLVLMCNLSIIMTNQKNQDFTELGFVEPPNMDDLFDQLEDKALIFYREQLPRMKQTRELVYHTMKLIDRNSPELNSYLEQNRCASIERAKEQRELFDDHYTLEKWRD